MEERMGTKELTVYRGSTKSYSPIPKIILQGHWLRDLGFSIGDKVVISYQQDKVIIERIAEVQEQQTQEIEPAGGRHRRKRDTNDRY